MPLERVKQASYLLLNAANNHIYWDDLRGSDKSFKVDINYEGSEYFNAIFGYQSRFVDRAFFWRQLNLIKKDDSELDSDLNTDRSQSYVDKQNVKRQTIL